MSLHYAFSLFLTSSPYDSPVLLAADNICRLSSTPRSRPFLLQWILPSSLKEAACLLARQSVTATM